MIYNLPIELGLPEADKSKSGPQRVLDYEFQ